MPLVISTIQRRQMSAVRLWLLVEFMAGEECMQEGRSCPLHYRRDPAELRRPADIDTGALLVAGGLYGNPEALTAVEAMAAENGVQLCLNGDFHWFDADAVLAERIEARTQQHLRTLGNVEVELVESSGAGCGCAYPDAVPDVFVERSNAIMGRLQSVVPDAVREGLAQLTPDLRVDVGGLRIAVIHGDPESLAGWGLAVEAREADSAGFERRLAEWFRAAEVDVIACAHTCLAHALRLTVDGRERVLINNGAAGMANFHGDPRGLVTRIAPTPSPAALYACRLGDLNIEAIPVAFDADAWLERFSTLWPAGSAAALNYAARIVDGPRHERERAIGPGFVAGALPGRWGDVP
jgi:hypothetical protein